MPASKIINQGASGVSGGDLTRVTQDYTIFYLVGFVLVTFYLVIAYVLRSAHGDIDKQLKMRMSTESKTPEKQR